jgi:hypothetical protein
MLEKGQILPFIVGAGVHLLPTLALGVRPHGSRRHRLRPDPRWDYDFNERINPTNPLI